MQLYEVGVYINAVTGTFQQKNRKKMAAGNSGNVYNITFEQSELIRKYAIDRGWDISNVPHAYYRISGERLSIVSYLSGKLVIQGANAAEFTEFILEPEILKTWSASANPASLDLQEVSLHGGIDESGKGDFFGPLVIAGCCVDENTAPLLRELGVCDSKKISSDKKICELARGIRNIVGSAHSVVMLKPETYNRLYSQIGNLNRLLAWGHARVIENLLTAVPECPRMLSDKFGSEHLIRRALMERGQKIKLEQQVRAESDVAVAAASILARDGFVYAMNKLGSEIGTTLPKGAGSNVKAAAKQLFEKHGKEFFEKYAKLHFKTYNETISGAE